jgi:hypothetical protein
MSENIRLLRQETLIIFRALENRLRAPNSFPLLHAFLPASV